MNTSARLPLLALGLLSLSSCALPPREAWRVIQHDGLLPYLSVEMGRRPVPPYVHLPSVPGPRFVTLTSSAKAPRAVVPGGGGQVYVTRPSCCLPASRYLEVGPAPVPKASPPKVAASKPAPVVVAPKPVPAASPKMTPKRPAAAEPRTVVTKQPRPQPETSAPPKVVKPAGENLADVPRAKLAPPDVPAAPKQQAPPVAAAGTPPSVPHKPAPAPVEKPRTEPGELPFGTAIPGRPGLVYSPFAGRYQLVDVTGLAPGQEVKCPYSGKIFRVPGSQQAKNDAKSLEPPPKKGEGEKKP